MDQNTFRRQSVDFLAPVKTLRVVCWWVWDSITDHREHTLATFTPWLDGVGFMEDEFVALWPVTTTGRRYGTDEINNFAHIISEVAVLGDVGAAGITIVAVGDDTNSKVGDFFEETLHGFGNFAADFGEDWVHGTSGVEAENDVNEVLHNVLPFLSNLSV